jgi:hypothetical protein
MTVILERGDVRVSRTCVQTGRDTYSVSQLANAFVRRSARAPDLAWFIYGLSALATGLLAMRSADPSLACVSLALLVFSVIAWQRRSAGTWYELVLTVCNDERVVQRTCQASEINLVLDAVLSVLPVAGSGRPADAVRPHRGFGVAPLSRVGS